jgi:hypothetical protein
MHIYSEATSDSDEEGRAIISSDSSSGSSDFNDDGSDAELVEQPPADTSTRRRVNRTSCRPSGECINSGHQL